MESRDDSAWTDKVDAFLDQYQDKSCIRLVFAYDPFIIQQIKQIIGRQWSQSRRVWFIPDTYKNRCRFGLEVQHGMGDPGRVYTANAAYNEVCRNLAQKAHDKIILKGYSPHTLRSYVNHINQYLKSISALYDPREVTREQIETYLLDRTKRKKVSESDTNMHINAIKFLYEQVLGRERMLFKLPRPEKPLQLPKVLGEHELERLFAAVTNLKHKAILLTAFSCGMRVSEVVSLRGAGSGPRAHAGLYRTQQGKKRSVCNVEPNIMGCIGFVHGEIQYPEGRLFV